MADGMGEMDEVRELIIKVTDEVLAAMLDEADEWWQGLPAQKKHEIMQLLYIEHYPIVQWMNRCLAKFEEHSAELHKPQADCLKEKGR